MFSCCVPRSGGTSLNPTRNESLFHHFRSWFRPQPRGSWPLARRYPKSSEEVVREELEEGLIYTVSLKKVQVHRGPSQGQRWFQKNDSALVEEETHMVRMVKAGPSEKLVEHLVPAFQEGDLVYVNIFLGTYRVFTTTEEVLDQLFQRYGRDLCGSDGIGRCLEMKNTLSSLLGTWMDQYPEDFLQPPDSPCLKQLVAYSQVHLPGSALEHRAVVLSSQMSHPERIEADTKGSLSAPELQMPPMKPEAPVQSPATDTGAVPEDASSPLPLLLPAPERKAALAPPLQPPTGLGTMLVLELDHPTSSAGAPAEELEAATSQTVRQVPEVEAPISPSDVAVPEPEASPAPPNLPPIHGSVQPTLEIQPAFLQSEEPALVLEEALVTPSPSPMEVATMTTLQVEEDTSPDVAPAARLDEVTSPSLSQVPELEAVPTLSPISPTQSAQGPILEPQPNSPSAAMVLEREASLASPPEPLPEFKSAECQAASSEPSFPWPETSENGLIEGKANLLAFPPELVAEHLTRMDSELFKKVVPYHCLGSIWSQRNKKGKEHVAPTVRAIITQLNCVTGCVITTCLGDQSMKAPDRARVVEHWIEVAKECRILNNYSSLYAILSALESQSIHRLKKTWEDVSRDSFHLFKTLSEIFSKENNYSQSSELIIKEEISKFATREMNPKRAQKKEQQLERGDIQGIVPYLGTFLTQFLMVDNTMQEYLEGRMVNFDKRRKENQIVAELQQIQAGCCYDSLVPNEQFGAWFGAMKQLSENDSYHLSCELEPPSQSASKSFKDKHHREGTKPWSEDLQALDAESSSKSAPHSSVQLQCGPDFSSGDAADSHMASSSSSKVIHLGHVPELQDDQEMKLEQSISESSQNSSTTASRGKSSSSSSTKSRASWFSRKHRNSQPCYKWHVTDYCIVHVRLDEDNDHQYKSIMVTNQERTPAVILKAMKEHNLEGDKPKDYKLVQIISEDQMLQISDSANVYYAMHPSPKYHLVLVKRNTPMDAKDKNRSISALLRKKLKGPKFRKRKI